MSEFGQCSEPSCSENTVRLFDCVHHCMKLVCLQHLIEHDRLIEHNQDYLNNLHTEVKQLWTTYSSLADETKLRFEFEQKLKKHQQLIRDISNLFEMNSVNVEHYRLMVEKLNQNIEQLNQSDTESVSHVEQVKIEPKDMISTSDELDSLNVSLATRIERLNNVSNQQQQRTSVSDDSSTMNEYDYEIDHAYDSTDNESIDDQTNNCSSLKNFSCECPFWRDGVFGLTEESHGMYLCPRKRKRVLYRHLIQFHKLTKSSVKKICRAIQNKENPSRTNLFQSTDIVLDQINQYQCPFSIYNDKSIPINNSSSRPCRTKKPQLKHILRCHLIRDHRMSKSNASQVVYKLKLN